MRKRHLFDIFVTRRRFNIEVFYFREWFYKRREEIRPWTTFVKTTNFEAPSSFPKLTKRVYKNVEYFQSNYVR